MPRYRQQYKSAEKNKKASGTGSSLIPERLVRFSVRNCQLLMLHLNYINFMFFTLPSQSLPSRKVPGIGHGQQTVPHGMIP